MANTTLHPYKGNPRAELSAFENGTDQYTMAPECVWQCTVTNDDIAESTISHVTVTLTFSGTETDGDYETLIRDENGALIETVTTTRAGAVPATNDDLATQHAADFAAFLATTLATTLESANADGATVVLVGQPGVLFRAVPSAPPPGALDAEHGVVFNLNTMQPNDAFPANALRGESPTIRVTEAWPASTVATLDNAGAASTDVLALVALDATGWVGDTGTSLGDAHKTETAWTPHLTIFLGDNITAATGELKVQVTYSPLPE